MSGLAQFGQLYALMMKATAGESSNASHFARHAARAERDHPIAFGMGHAEGLRLAVLEHEIAEHLTAAEVVAFTHGHAAGQLRAAHAQGVAAGLTGASPKSCPFQPAENETPLLRRVWLAARKDTAVAAALEGHRRRSAEGAS